MGKNTIAPEQRINDEKIMDAPAPWHLRGQAYVCVLRTSPSFMDKEIFTEEKIRDKRIKKSHPLMIFVDYQQSPVGPYYELLFIPGYFAMDDEAGQKFLSISRIFVSSMNSVINGRRNWGIPKDFATFDVKYNEDGIDKVTVQHQGHTFAELAFRAWPLQISIPFSTRILPKSWRTFIQYENNSSYKFCPESNCWFRPAHLIKAQFDQNLFPPICSEMVLGTIKITEFKLNFPKAFINNSL